MIDLALFRNAEFALGALAALVVFMGIASTRFLVPFFLQAVRGIPAEQVGLVFVPAATVTAIAAPFAGRFADRFGIRLFANVGMGITLLGFATFCLLGTGTPFWRVVAGLMVMSLGMSLFSAANSASMLNAVEEHSHGVAAGFVSLCRNSGNVIGIAFGTVIVTLTMGALGLSADARGGRAPTRTRASCARSPQASAMRRRRSARSCWRCSRWWWCGPGEAHRLAAIKGAAVAQ